MSRKRLTSPEKQCILDLLAEGRSLEEVARIVGRAKRTIFEVKHNPPPGVRDLVALRQLEHNPPKAWDDLDDLAKRCLESFEFFATTLFCLRTPFWWTKAAEQLVHDVTSDDETFTLLHAPTGSGKTTLLETLVMWLMSGGGTCDPETGRALRFMFGGSTVDKAIRSVDRLRRIVEDPRPFWDAKRRVQAKHSMLELFGRFKPAPGEDDVSVWRQGQFTVALVGDHPLAQRDPTVSAYSLGAGQARGASPLSVRADIIVVDDPALMETLGDESLLERFEAEFESRLEPEGSLFAVGQRLGAGDLYGSLAARRYSDDSGDQLPTYTVASFPAHRDHDGNDHDEWDGSSGCLLDAVRLPWKKLQREAAKASYLPMYQQDVESSSALGLIERAWIDGTMDSTGYAGPGVWDVDRAAYEAIVDENGRAFPAYISIDPGVSESPWALELWQVDPRTRKRYLIGGVRGRFSIREILDNDSGSGSFTGELPDLCLRAATVGCRPTALVIESNAARHFLESQVWDLWRRIWSEIVIVPFVTSSGNKNSPVIGVSALLQPAYRNGEVRWPRVGLWDYLKVKVDELTRVRPKHDDTTLAEWVGIASLDKIIAGSRRRGPSPTIFSPKTGKYYRKSGDGVRTMSIYGVEKSIADMPQLPYEREAGLTLDEQQSRNRVRADLAVSNEVARAALGLPTRQSPEERNGRPDGVNP